MIALKCNGRDEYKTYMIPKNATDLNIVADKLTFQHGHDANTQYIQLDEVADDHDIIHIFMGPQCWLWLIIKIFLHCKVVLVTR